LGGHQDTIFILAGCILFSMVHKTFLDHHLTMEDKEKCPHYRREHLLLDGYSGIKIALTRVITPIPILMKEAIRYQSISEGG